MQDVTIEYSSPILRSSRHFSRDRIFLCQFLLCRDETFIKMLGKPYWTIHMRARNITWRENIYKSKNLNGTHLTKQLFTHRWHMCNAVSILSFYIQLHYTISFNTTQINVDSMLRTSEKEWTNSTFHKTQWGVIPVWPRASTWVTSMVIFDHL